MVNGIKNRLGVFNANSVFIQCQIYPAQTVLDKVESKRLLTYLCSTKVSLSTFITFITVGTVVSRFKQVQFKQDFTLPKGTSMYYVSTKGGGRGSSKCLRLLMGGGVILM